ncbi:MAG: DinB family protein [Verrucomicrobiota bacterium]
MEKLIHANMHYLQQASRLLDSMTDELFTQPAPSFYNSSVGGHLRHCLDHYDSFLNGITNGKIDYDARMRLPELESKTTNALAKTQEVSQALSNLLSSEPPVGLLVKMDCGLANIEWQPSTSGRELQFLVSHTVHHFAMIGGICNEIGVPLEPDFGVAPSTLRHRETAESA